MLPLQLRKIISVARCIIAAAFCLGSVFLAKAAPPINKIPDVGLVVLSEPGLRLTGRNQANFECGKINSLDNPQVEHRFTFRNDAELPLAITHFETNCHCTTVNVEKIAGQPAATDAFVYYLLPGQEMEVKLAVNLVRQHFGPMSHGAALLVSGNERPVAHIQVSGEIEVPLVVSASELDFGQMKRGETQSLTLTITLDHRLLSGGVFPELVVQSSNELAARIGDVIKIVPQARRSSPQEKSYEIVVKPTQAGAFAARLIFAPIARADYKGSIPYVRAMEVLGSLVVDVHGDALEK